MAAVAAAAGAAAVAAGRVPLLRPGEGIPNEYIAVFKNEIELPAMKAFAASVGATRTFEFGGHLKAMYGVFRPEFVELLRDRTDLFSYIEQNQVMRTFGRQANATWGLDRIDQVALPLDTFYNYYDSAGAGVNAYVIDTGVNAGHVEFTGRVTLGPNFHESSATSEDDNGHGTHCAGTIGGTEYGVAKSANVIGVKVLGRLGSGSLANVAAGVEWAADQHATNPDARSVASMSLGGTASALMDQAVQAAIARGLPVIAASGNSNADGCTFSPARVATLSVNAADSSDRRASFSNFGTCTHLFAPGVSITSAWIGSSTATNTISGTSMACPHVSGAVAVLLGERGRLSPTEVKEAILANAIKDVIGNPGNGSPNNNLYVPYA
jgi:subtilisin family serine protease